MGRKKELLDINCVTFGLLVNNTQNKALTNMFNMVTDYKNEYIKFIWKNIYTYCDKDSIFKESINIIKNQRKLYGTAVNKDDLDKDVDDAYTYIIESMKDSNKIMSLTNMLNEFMKVSSKKYKIYLPDDIRHNALDDVNQGFIKMIYKRVGQNVQPKKYDDLLAVRCKPMYAKKKDGTIDTKNQSSVEILLENNQAYLLCYDCTYRGLNHIFSKYDEINDVFKTNTGKCPTHKTMKLKINYNKNDLLQKQILDNIYKGSIKISRLFKKGSWRYRLQINFEQKSPIIDNINFQNKQVAINVNTEMVAVVDSDGNQNMIELTPNTPRITTRMIELSNYMNSSRKCNNKDLYLDDGQYRYTKRQMNELGLNWKISKGYNKAKMELKELYRLNSEQRKRNNFILAKQILQMGNNYILDKNQYKAWQMKLNRMNKNSKIKYDNGIRKANDYAKQVKDHAPGMFTARIKQICDQLQLPCIELSNFKSSTYNHFTGENDIFLKLNERCVTFKNKNNYIDDITYNETTIPFIQSIGIMEYNGKRYILQRDLYAASKMLFITKGTETRIDKNTGKQYTVTTDVFNNKAFSIWFDEIFYPKHIEYLKQIAKKLDCDIDINDLIIGN